MALRRGPPGAIALHRRVPRGPPQGRGRWEPGPQAGEKQAFRDLEAMIEVLKIPGSKARPCLARHQPTDPTGRYLLQPLESITLREGLIVG